MFSGITFNSISFLVGQKCYSCKFSIWAFYKMIFNVHVQNIVVVYIISSFILLISIVIFFITEKEQIRISGSATSKEKGFCE